MRYLVRLANDSAHTPKDVAPLQQQIRKVLGSHEKIGNLRVSTSAVEFDLFAEKADLERFKTELESKVSKIITLRPIDNRLSTRNDVETLREGVSLFNEERFWEAHEVLEEIWHAATGNDRNIIQGIILAAAAFVHCQKNEMNVCISILNRALEKLDAGNEFREVDIRQLRFDIMKMIDEKEVFLPRISWIRARNTLQVL